MGNCFASIVLILFLSLSSESLPSEVITNDLLYMDFLYSLRGGGFLDLWRNKLEKGICRRLGRCLLHFFLPCSRGTWGRQNSLQVI